MSHQNLLTPLPQPKTTKSHDSHPTQLSDLNNNPNTKFPKYVLQLINLKKKTNKKYRNKN